MEQHGIEVPLNLMPEGLKLVHVLEEYDGIPLLKEYSQGFSEDIYLHSWVSCDQDHTRTRWMVFRIEKWALIRYINLKLDFSGLLETIPENRILLLDLDSSNNPVGLYYIKSFDLPSDYCPEPAAMFDPSKEMQNLLYKKDHNDYENSGI